MFDQCSSNLQGYTAIALANIGYTIIELQNLLVQNDDYHSIVPPLVAER
jgi:hypothetical protein